METSSTTGLWSEELTRRTEEQRQQRQQPLRHPPSYLYHSHAKEEEEEEEEEEHDRENEEEVEEEEEQSYYMQEEGEEEMETTTELLTQTFTSTLSISGERRKQAEQEQDEEEAYIEEVEEEEEDGSALVMELQQLEQERQHEEQEQQQQQRQQQQQQQQQQRSINKTFMVVEERRRAASFSFSAAPPLDFLDEVYIAGSASAAAASSSSSLSQRSAPQMHPKNNDEGGEEVMPTWQVLRCYQQLREEISRLQAEKMTLESAVARQKRYEATLSNENNSKNKVGGTESSRKRRLQRSYDLLDDAEKRLLEMEAALVQRRVRMLRLVKELSKRRAAEGSENASGNGGRRRRERNRHGRSRSGSRCYRREPQAQAQTQPLPQIQLTLPLPTPSSSSDVTTTSSFSPRFAIQQQTILTNNNNTNQSLSSSLEEEDPYFSVTASSSPSSPFSSSSCFSSLTPPTKSRLDLRRASIHIQVQSKKRTETESESEGVMATTPTTRERRTRSLVQEPLPRILPVEVADPMDPFPRCFQEEAEDRRADLILQRILQDVQKAEEEEEDEEEEDEEDAIDGDEEDSDEDADEEDDDEQGRERNYITRVKLKAHNGGFRNGSKKQKNREAKKQELVGYSDSLRKDQRCNNFLLLEAEVLQEIADIRVNSNELELLRVVGKGAYGEVFLARWKNQDVAVKRLSLQAKDPKLQVEHRKQVLRAFRREVACLRRASNHPNIVKVYGAYITEQYCGIVMEYMSGGSLHDVLHLHKTAFSLRRSLQLAKDVAEGMRYIHSLNVIHRDVTTHNLLFHPQDANRGQLFVGDFGIAIFKQKRTVITTSGNKKRLPMSPVGHPRYRAPEITRNELYSKRADVYTFGTVLYELFVRQKPWPEMNDMEVALRASNGGSAPPVPSTVPLPLAQLMLRCWSDHPKDRPSFKQLCGFLEEAVNRTNNSNNNNGSEEAESDAVTLSNMQLDHFFPPPPSSSSSEHVQQDQF